MTTDTPASMAGIAKTPADVAKELTDAQTAKIAGIKTAKQADKALKDADAAAKNADAALKKTQAAAAAADQALRKKQTEANRAKAQAAAGKAAEAQDNANKTAQELDKAKAAAEEAAKAREQANHTYAKLKNEQLKNSMPSSEFEELLRQIELNCGNEHFIDGVVKPCPGRFKTRNCAGESPDVNARMDATAMDNINKDLKTDIDFDQLAQWEGGQAVSAYVPWFPIGMKVTDGVIEANTRRVPGTDVLQGGSKSGVTIGTGVDLGQQDATKYFERLKKAGASQELLDKLQPYMGLQRSAACSYLREHPLTLTKEEVDFIDSEMKAHHIQGAADFFNQKATELGSTKKFEQLTEAEQTVLVSRKYQQGNLRSNENGELITHLVNDSKESAVAHLTVENYPHSSMKDRIPKEQEYLRRMNAEDQCSRLTPRFPMLTESSSGL